MCAGLHLLQVCNCASVQLCTCAGVRMRNCTTWMCVRVASILWWIRSAFVVNYTRPVQYMFSIWIRVVSRIIYFSTCINCSLVLKMCFCCFVWLSWISSDSQCIPLFFRLIFECSMIFIYFVDFIDSERARRRAGLERCACTFFTSLNQKSERAGKKAQTSVSKSQFAYGKGQGSQNVRHVPKSSFRSVVQKMDVRFGLRTGRKPYFYVRKRMLAGWLAGVVAVGSGRWDCWAAKTSGFDIHDLWDVWDVSMFVFVCVCGCVSCCGCVWSCCAMSCRVTACHVMLRYDMLYCDLHGCCDFCKTSDAWHTLYVFIICFVCLLSYYVRLVFRMFFRMSCVWNVIRLL